MILLYDRDLTQLMDPEHNCKTRQQTATAESRLRFLIVQKWPVRLGLISHSPSLV